MRALTKADEIGAADWLVCRAGSRLCALPIASVVETMRPLPLERLARAPSFVCGLSLIRGALLPVVDAGSLFGESNTRLGRLVTINVGTRLVALGVDEVLGVHAFPPSASTALPQLLQSAGGDIISAIGTLDAELVLFLQTARVLTDEVLTDMIMEGSVP